jgi:hypothetical protein
MTQNVIVAWRKCRVREEMICRQLGHEKGRHSRIVPVGSGFLQLGQKRTLIGMESAFVV